jgi:hypothetical protein
MSTKIIFCDLFGVQQLWALRNVERLLLGFVSSSPRNVAGVGVEGKVGLSEMIGLLCLECEYGCSKLEDSVSEKEGSSHRA